MYRNSGVILDTRSFQTRFQIRSVQSWRLRFGLGPILILEKGDLIIYVGCNVLSTAAELCYIKQIINIGFCICWSKLRGRELVYTLGSNDEALSLIRNWLIYFRGCLN